MWRSPRQTGSALVALVALAGGVARLEAGVVVGSVARVDADKTTVSVTIDREQIENLPQNSRRLDELALLVPGLPSGAVQAGHLPARWSFDPVRLRASGPAISGGKFRFDFPAGWKPPSKLGLEGYFGGKLEFKLRVPLTLQPPIKVDTDLGRWLDLPQTLQLGSSIWLSSRNNRLGTPVEWTISPYDVGRIEVLKQPTAAVYGSDALAGTVCQITGRPLGAPPGGQPTAGTRYDGVEATLDKSFSDNWGLVSSYRYSKLRLNVEGRNAFGETLVRGDWTPTVTPPCHHPPTAPSFGGVTEIVAPHETFCVCGQVGDLGQWQGLGLGGTSLGVPITATTTSAVFLPPAGLGPGSYPITYGPAGSASGTGLTTSYIDVRGEVDDKKIRSGGSTPLTLEILGTDRSFPVTLTNTTPTIIDLEGGLRQVISTSGGSPNQIRRTVTGLRPGDYTVDYEVALPTCPCDATNLQVAERAGDEFLGLANGFNRQLAHRWMLRQRLGSTPATPVASELRFGAGYRDAEVTSLSGWPSSPGCVHLGGPVACPQGLPPGSFSERFVPGGTTWSTPSGESVFVPSRSFGFLAPEFAGVSPSNDFQSTRVEQPSLPPSEVFAPGTGSGSGSGESGRYGEGDAGELDGQTMHPVQATEYRSALGESGGSPLADPAAGPAYKSEFLGGIEFEVARSVSLGVRYVHREMPEILSDPRRTTWDSEVPKFDLVLPGQLWCKPGSTFDLFGNRFRGEIEWAGGAGPVSGACRGSGGDEAITTLFDFPAAGKSAFDPGRSMVGDRRPLEFHPDNRELLVKILNGCAINNRYWVFAAATTDVEYTLSITDAKSGRKVDYQRPPGSASPAIVDTEAFATCP